ncbi:MAG: SIS domain-containing protein [Acidimicrobiales bacterium]
MNTLDVTGTALWQDMCETPETVAASLDAATGHGELARLLASHRTGRIVATGNGASFYVATSLWLASLSAQLPAPVVAVPAGLLATDTFTLRPDDLLLAFSASGELRDLIEIATDPQRSGALGLVTSTPSSTLAAQADAVALVEVRNQRAVTHTQAYLGAAAVALDVLGRASGDSSLRAAADTMSTALSAQLVGAVQWADEAAEDLAHPRAAVVFGTGQALVAASEAALLLKEVAGLPAEGMETREGATSGMYALGRDQLVLALPVGSDPLAEEAVAICSGTGAAVLTAPWPHGLDRKCAVAAHFAHPLALAVRVALAQGHDPDNPNWYATYKSTARVAVEQVPQPPLTGPGR